MDITAQVVSSLRTCVCMCVSVFVSVASALYMCSVAVASKQCVINSYRCSSLQLLLQVTLRELHKLGPIMQQVHTCVHVHACVRACVHECMCVHTTYVFVWVSVSNSFFVYVNDLCVKTYSCKQQLVFSSFKKVITHQAQ